MLIDWFTVFAQMVNFLILVYLLKRFLYTPILNAIDERERRIAAQLEDAAQLKVEAQGEQQRYQQLNQDLNQRKETLLHEARDGAASERLQLLEEARREYAGLRKSLKDKLDAEQLSLHHEIKRRTQQEVFDIARKALADLSGTSLESQIVTVFLQKLSALSREEAELLRIGLKPNGDPLSVRSAFDLEPAQQAAVEQAVKNLLGSDVQVQFRVSPLEVGGIELAADGYKLAWTIAEYMDGLEKRMDVLAEGMSGTHSALTPSSHEY
jgi:F-type H+-transporting ATPase subunit b